MINWALYLMAFLYLAAGITHFTKPRMYIRIMPPAIPWPKFWVYLTGVWEMMAAILVLIPQTRSLAAWSIIVLLILVLPANVQMATNFRRRRNPYYWVTLLRLPLQLALIYWAWLYT